MRRILFSLLTTGMAVLLITCSKPDNTAFGYWDNAVALFNQSDYQGCIKQYQRIIKYFPDDSLAVPAMFAMADVYKNNLNDADQAIKIYKEIILFFKILTVHFSSCKRILLEGLIYFHFRNFSFDN